MNKYHECASAGKK